MLKAYFAEIFKTANQGDAREESFYPTLKKLLEAYANSVKKSGIQVTSLPKKTEAGNPDFRIWDGKQHIVGYIEAKAPNIEYLDQVESSEQLERYLRIFPNVILTNFFEFRLYRNGILTDRVLVARSNNLFKLKTIPPVEKETEFLNLLEKFFSFSLPQVYNAKTLAVELAKRTRFLRDEVIAEQLKEEEFSEDNYIFGFYKAFKKYLISGLSKEDFADLYSQTITYGLFAARTRTENTFNRKLAYDNIPSTIGILRDLFKFISLGNIPQQMEWIIDDISEVLSVTDVKKILHQYFHEGKGKDPIVHFYETFLTEYDPKTREKRGVYYTPEPVVSYIVRSLHKVLKEKFNRAEGLANEKVTILDPAAGTLTFLTETAKVALEEFISKYGEGGKSKFIKEHILKNFFAFELMMAPYAIGHLKMSFLLEELGYKLQKDDRFKLYLTNTLEMEELSETALPGMASLSEESHLAGKVKKEQPILVILGNPPYHGHSSNVGKWISDEIKVYYQVDRKPLNERNSKWLRDDYVKFIRFAQWKIEQAGEGILGFITNHNYLDAPTFRGMRQSLINSFNEIYILDLHGSSQKKLKGSSKDENIFKIEQGVAIAIYIKKKNSKESNVYHSELWGLRNEKFELLSNNDIYKTKWKKLSPKSESYLFIPRNEKLLGKYEDYLKITDIFPTNSVGIVTARDEFVVNFDKEKLKRNINLFCDEKMTDEIIAKTFHFENKMDWLKQARQELRKDEDWKDTVTQILYRPFDIRWILYHDSVVERSRKDIMGHMLQENLGLITCRQQNQIGFCHALIAKDIIEACVVSNKTREINYLFPLYLYPKKESFKKRASSNIMMLFEPDVGYGEKKSNLSSVLIEQLIKDYKKTPEPEQILYYIYAVLYSEIYRKKYAEFLKMDFPRIPFTKEYKVFEKMSKMGEKLVDMHLLKSKELDSPVARLQGKNDNKIEKVKYDEKENRVYFNNLQYFEGVKKEIWEYQIGGYQVCDKWLKDRKEKSLSLEEIKYYCKIVTSLEKTIKIQEDIDEIYPEIEKSL
ncbi:DNA methyltransferase [Candidatus Desantisbacteria bacterium CG_4_10_14_0_8_um_filter_48_22]|uniref:site-specific DNA-methyltransferase (adenine-specific) n=1 Tax=Candidatus Desantisbacteria bacterium CG_4_10_14_0_8_um_filter_48_22 TaxID=1974543 RepID=A0A2M7S9R2_9BACT|nr:MAG: DNA methyltransferase [Candidatus Desantisbacteria bacterium CG1_02_49_89]PIV56955.1 MAG: DNA methyltransferase [Candidatus Desantisbacteria bacterium CG02_land_8_20_14_3_00_49_13]PIZ16033.1 MAG: DNA methyltransferase [Candidatus Desantisbacteria bacterium CG_4_10_14_0_8_um_filter_48_22]